ncbi:hypothetical protein F0562_025010 [Nyssa sinensis]|uniref:TCP domain-containing protein n=1 Tax=Nyssa sinensis TaxID=561372 RepID=A0A5J5BH35_9ASTE|nr:hypothetical protein F0562_025010 [Nyssa sinensis]
MMREDDHKFKKDLQAKLEGRTDDSKFSKASSSSRQWSGFKNPRIVRVSRSFGGKDRHSKVCTIRGLRDRRIRLSVQTAIQLYDIQDRLGLSQPSKVVDWLLDATKQEIDKLPPLQMPPGNFSTQLHQPTLVSHESNASQSSLSPFLNVNQAYIRDGGTQSFLSSKQGIDINYNVGEPQAMEKSKAWDIDTTLRAKCKQVERESTAVEKLFPIPNHSSFPNFLNNSVPYNSYGHWEPSNLSLSQFGSHGLQSQAEDPHTSHSVPLPSSLALPSVPQLFFYPSAASPSFFHQYPPYITTPAESDPRQTNPFQLLSSSSQDIPPNPLMSSLHSVSPPLKSSLPTVNSRFLHLDSQNNDDSQPNKSSTGS